MGNIVLLDELTINKIAAGEVIERPASVIKEMVENSIDAGATNINIEIKNGGISYIRITDNGRGIASDDMEIAFERHATSKIRTADDLKQVRSMGFRGEALASIASIANVEMISRTSDEQIGNRIIVEAGKVLAFEEAGCQVGTIVTVQNLFFNTPVRYKFLKKDYTESGYIEDAITRLALIHPEIAFRLINTGKTIIQTSGNGKIQDVIYSIYGKDIASSILDVNYTYEDIHVTGVVGKPEIARSNRSNQIFFVNKRFIKDKILTGATENSFKGLLPIGKYGFLVLNIDMNPSLVDVNVHPAKLEVRFQEENKVYKAIYHAIRDTLLKAELIANTEKTIDEKENISIPKIPQTTSITDLFRKISKDQEKDKGQYNIGQFSVATNEKKEENNQASEVKHEENEKEKSTLSSLGQSKKMDVFQELLAMQQKLKEETQSNPNLHTNIDQLINNTKNLENNYSEKSIENKLPVESIIENELPIESMVENKLPVENVVENKLPVESVAENKLSIENVVENELPIESVTEKSDNIITYKEQEDDVTKNSYQIKEEKESYEIKGYGIIEDKEEKRDNIEEQEAKASENIIHEEQNVEDNGNNKEIEKDNEETKIFTSEEIQDMMNKLEKIDNVEESPEFANMYEKIFGKLPASVEEEKREQEKKLSAYELIKDNNVSVFETEEEFNKPTYRLVGIAFNTYIIIEIKDELYIIDQHAAHERVMYEKVKENYYSDNNKESQMLLLPDVITLTHKEMDILKDNYAMFEKAGFELEEFGENTIKLTGIPNICFELDTKELFLETLDEINQVARTAKQEIEEKFIATVACKAAVKANMNLTPEEVESLMNELLKLPNPFTCPHGRPTAIKMDKKDLEKKFSRRK